MAGENFSYTGTPNALQMDKVQSFPASNLNPVGSQYAAAQGYDTTDMIQQEMERIIIDTIPQRLKMGLTMFLDRPVLDKNLDEFTWKERVYGRMPIKSSGSVSGGTTQSVPLVAGGGKLVTLNKMLIYPSGAKGIVSAISGDTITIKAQSGGTLPALVANDYLQVMAGLIGDGGNMAYHFDRITTITRRNYIQFMERNKEWSRLEKTKWENAGTTNIMDLEKTTMRELLMEDIFVNMWNSTMGEFDITTPGGTVQSKAKTTMGIYPFLVASGAKHATSTALTFADDFADLAFATNSKAASVTRFIFGTPELLFKLDKVLKNPIRYTPADKSYDMNLNQYDIGDMKFVKVPISVFGETGLFPSGWGKRIFCIDMDNIFLAKIKGYNLFEMGETPWKKDGATLEDYKKYWLTTNIGLEFRDVMGSFYMDLQGM